MNCKGSITVAIRQQIVGGRRGDCAICGGTFRGLIERGNDNLVPIHEPVVTDVALGYLRLARQRKG